MSQYYLIMHDSLRPSLLSLSSSLPLLLSLSSLSFPVNDKHYHHHTTKWSLLSSSSQQTFDSEIGGPISESDGVLGKAGVPPLVGFQHPPDGHVGLVDQKPVVPRVVYPSPRSRLLVLANLKRLSVLEPCDIRYGIGVALAAKVGGAIQIGRDVDVRVGEDGLF